MTVGLHIPEPEVAQTRRTRLELNEYPINGSKPILAQGLPRQAGLHTNLFVKFKPQIPASLYGKADSTMSEIVSKWHRMELNDHLTREKDTIHPYVLPA